MVNIQHKQNFDQKYPLNLSSNVYPVYNLLSDRDIILKKIKHKSGVYLIHNSVNGKQYIGSGIDLGRRLGSYYFPSRLIDNRYISNSILKYGHNNFSVVILYILEDTNIPKKTHLLKKEQEYIDLYKPVLNLNPTAGSSLGFKHSEESKKLIAEFRKGKPLSDKTKKRISDLFSGELNPFWSKTHSPSTLEKMRTSKLGELNPMFNKEKSKEFIENMHRDKKGSNNPMFGVTKSEKTLEKLRKKIYVYDGITNELIASYDSIGLAVKNLSIASGTINKYLDTGIIYKNKYFYSKLQ